MCRKETSDNIRERLWSMEQEEQRTFMDVVKRVGVRYSSEVVCDLCSEKH